MSIPKSGWWGLYGSSTFFLFEVFRNKMLGKWCMGELESHKYKLSMKLGYDGTPRWRVSRIGEQGKKSPEVPCYCKEAILSRTQARGQTLLSVGQIAGPGRTGKSQNPTENDKWHVSCLKTIVVSPSFCKFYTSAKKARKEYFLHEVSKPL